MSAPLTWSLRSAHALLRTAARLSFRPSKLHLVVESTAALCEGKRTLAIIEIDDKYECVNSTSKCNFEGRKERRAAVG